MTKHANKSQRIALICKCGCGEPVPQAPGAGRPRVWIEEHKPGRAQARDCECGCGLPVVRMLARGTLPRFFPGHSPSARKFPTRNKVP